MLPWVILTAAALAGLLFAEARGAHRLAALCKPLASTGFVGAALAAGALTTAYGRLVLAALVLSWVGDVLLLSQRPGAFLGGLLAFLFGHVAFGFAFAERGTDHLWTLAALAVLVLPALLVDRWLRPHAPANLKIPVRAYIVVITGMLALAAGTLGAGATPLILLGALAFYLSDLSVARDRFLREELVNRLWGLPLYYAAQLLLAASVGAGPF
jgi:uncharacterized membrane protein YhhN